MEVGGESRTLMAAGEGEHPRALWCVRSWLGDRVDEHRGQAEGAERPRARRIESPTAQAEEGSKPSTDGLETADGLEAALRGATLLDEDSSLADRASRGDEDALCSLLSHYGPQVRERIKAKIGAQWRTALDEDDVMQVTYLEAFLLIAQFKHRGRGSFLAWLSQVAENNLRDALRGLQAAKRPNPKNRVQTPTSGENSFVALVELLGATYSTPSRAAARGESERLIEDVLSALPPDYERVVRLYDLEGRSAQEVAEQLGRSTGAIYMLRARAHEKMRGSLGNASRFFTDPG